MEYQYNESEAASDDWLPEVPKNRNMAIASMVMGILGLVLSCCCMGTLFGGLAVTFACLSKTESYYDTKAKAGLIMGMISIALSVLMFAFIMAASLAQASYGDFASMAKGYLG